MDARPSRSNGLPATVWTPMADLHPQLADIMLTILRDEGVAAYVAPAQGSPGSFLQVRIPDQPTDRLFVDASAAGRAKQVLLEHLPGLQAALHDHPAGSSAPGTPPDNGPRAATGRPTGHDAGSGGGGRPGGDGRPGDAGPDEGVSVDEQVWAQIVADYEASPAVDPVPRWPASEDVDDSRTPGPAADWPQETAGWPDAPPGRRHGPAAGRREPGAVGDADDAGDHFEPPEPPPVPVGSPVSRLAWAGVLGGPAFLVLAALAGWHLTGLWALAPLAAFVAGFVTLVVRMRERPDDGDDPDDGAVV